MVQGNGVQPRRSWFEPGNTVGFQKGQSGNPGGMRKVARAAIELARENTPEAIDKLVALMRGECFTYVPDRGSEEGCRRVPVPVQAAVQLEAGRVLLERALGKPVVVPDAAEDDKIAITRIERVIVRPGEGGTVIEHCP